MKTPEERQQEILDKQTIWEQLDRYIGSIRDEIRSDDTDPVSIDFWLFKIERRIKTLKDTIEILNSK